MHLVRAAFIVAALAAGCAAKTHAQTKDFGWVNLHKDRHTVSAVERILSSEQYWAIREIALIGHSALVFTTSRESSTSPPGYDAWTVYNVSLKDQRSTVLLQGYRLEFKDLLQRPPKDSVDLAYEYLHCVECEPTVLFTAFYYEAGIGWRARWPNNGASRLPGAVLAATGAGEPYDDEDVDQVYALLHETAGYSVGTWYHSRDIQTGKITDEVTKYSVDALGHDTERKLTGAAATAFKRQLCNSEQTFVLAAGQNSASCKRLRNGIENGSK